MTRAKLTQKIVETRYPLYDTDMLQLIDRVYKAHRGMADVEEHLVKAIWEEYSGFLKAELSKLAERIRRVSRQCNAAR